MKNLLKVAMVAIGATMLASCATVRPVGVTSNTLGSKVGEATEFRIFGIPVSTAGVDRAARSAGITKISHVDQRTQFFWPIIGKSKTVVYGE